MDDTTMMILIVVLMYFMMTKSCGSTERFTNQPGCDGIGAPCKVSNCNYCKMGMPDRMMNLNDPNCVYECGSSNTVNQEYKKLLDSKNAMNSGNTAAVKHAVRCCRKDSDARLGMNTYGCHDGKTFQEAGKICSDKGFTLCKADQLKNQAGTGCGFDGKKVWVQGNMACSGKTGCPPQAATQAPTQAATQAPTQAATTGGSLSLADLKGMNLRQLCQKL